ncbi:MAG: M23 family metallopeptidase [Defluviitaleaceae bacterium]|nr:M23 family metallopeptidase [Defluviitaleaceae bacterium]
MKNRFKQKGFHYSLYACLCIVLAGAIMVAIYVGRTPEVVTVDTLSTNILPQQPPRAQMPVTNVPTWDTPVPMEEADIREFFNLDTEGTVASEQLEPVSEPTPVPVEQPSPQAMDVIDVDVIPVFNSFSEGSVMLWPVMGEVLMEYSSDQFVFDTTLNLYRTHDSINISAEVGDNVRAAAEGRVVNVFHERRYGNSVTIDHGNGWATTYNQLENIEVSPGDIVSTGQIIGQVSEPTIFTSGLGENIGFRVTYHNDTINPLTVLQN